MQKKRVLIIYFSYSGQTRKLITAFAAGLEAGGAEVVLQPIKPREKLQFPLGSIASALKMMVVTFFRKRIAIEPVEVEKWTDCDMVVAAGPTWSYSPSGPMLSFFDRYGSFFKNNRVLPFVSCRGYWRVHYWQLRYMLQKRGARVLKPLVFLHIGPEPWRTIGVFLKIAGKMPEAERSWISRYYRRFGHTREQIDYARSHGERVAAELHQNGMSDDVAGAIIGTPPPIT